MARQHRLGRDFAALAGRDFAGLAGRGLPDAITGMFSTSTALSDLARHTTLAGVTARPGYKNLLAEAKRHQTDHTAMLGMLAPSTRGLGAARLAADLAGRDFAGLAGRGLPDAITGMFSTSTGLSDLARHTTLAGLVGPGLGRSLMDHGFANAGGLLDTIGQLQPVRTFAPTVASPTVRETLPATGPVSGALLGQGPVLEGEVVLEQAGWTRTSNGLWVPPSTQMVAVVVGLLMLSLMVWLYISEANRTGVVLADENKVDLINDFLGLLPLPGVAYGAVHGVARLLRPHQDDSE